MEGFLFECTKLREIAPQFVLQCFERKFTPTIHQFQLSPSSKDPDGSNQVPWGQGRLNLSLQKEEAGIGTPRAGDVRQ